LENWFKIEFISTYKLHITPLELDQMEFYRIEYMMKNFEESLEEEEKQYKKQQKEYEKSYKTSSPTPKSPTQSSSYGGFKTPKVEMPRMPSLKVP